MLLSQPEDGTSRRSDAASSVSLSTIREFFAPENAGPAIRNAAVEISRAMGWRGNAATLYEPVPGSLEAVLGPLSTAGGER